MISSRIFYLFEHEVCSEDGIDVLSLHYARNYNAWALISNNFLSALSLSDFEHGYLKYFNFRWAYCKSILTAARK